MRVETYFTSTPVCIYQFSNYEKNDAPWSQNRNEYNYTTSKVTFHHGNILELSKCIDNLEHNHLMKIASIMDVIVLGRLMLASYLIVLIRQCACATLWPPSIGCIGWPPYQQCPPMKSPMRKKAHSHSLLGCGSYDKEELPVIKLI